MASRGKRREVDIASKAGLARGQFGVPLPSGISGCQSVEVGSMDYTHSVEEPTAATAGRSVYSLHFGSRSFLAAYESYRQLFARHFGRFGIALRMSHRYT